jgi:hypothetical protein
MKRHRHTGGGVQGILRFRVHPDCRRNRYGGTGVEGPARLKAQEAENAQLKKIAANQALALELGAASAARRSSCASNAAIAVVARSLPRVRHAGEATELTGELVKGVSTSSFRVFIASCGL